MKSLFTRSFIRAVIVAVAFALVITGAVYAQQSLWARQVLMTTVYNPILAEPDPGTPGKTGDANGDGIVDTGDITKIRRIYFGIDGPTLVADANQDGVVDTGDITKVKRIYFGIDVPAPCTDAEGIEALLVTADHRFLKTYSWGYKVGKEQEYHIECLVADTSAVVSYSWSCDRGEISGQGAMITWTAPSTSGYAIVTAVVSDIAGNMACKNVTLNVVNCSACTFGC